MKKNVLIIITFLLIIIISCIVLININSKSNRTIKKQNKEYEQYIEKEIYGTDVVTLINKAISSNENNNVPKDNKGIYISNNENSIKIDLIMITNEEKEKTTTYKMEAIYKVGIEGFIKNFNTAKFKCSKVEYHKLTGKIAYIEITQQY